MKKEYDFSKGERGKFYNENIEINIPIYLEPDVNDFVKNIAMKNNEDSQSIVNNIIKKNMQLAKLLQ
jgi:hypothetical protein